MKLKPIKTKTRKLAKSYEPTPRELTAMKAFFKESAQSGVPRMKVSENKKGGFELKLEHPDTTVALILLMEAVGAKDFSFLNGFLKQLSNVGTHGTAADENGINFMLSVVKGIKPKDQVEAMLAAQMAAVHLATMTFARRLAHVDNIQQQDSAERAFNKLTRTFASQMEALKRYRSEGQQQIIVKHVTTVNAEKAVVTTGDPTHAQENTGHRASSVAFLTAATDKPMPMLDETKQPRLVGMGGGVKSK